MTYRIPTLVQQSLVFGVLLSAATLGGCAEAPAPQSETPASAPAATEAPAETMAQAMASLVSEAPADAQLYIIAPEDGATVTSPVRVLFGLRGMGVAPAGQDVKHTGHHHLLIDEPSYELAQPLPATEQIKHFGAGQTETEVTLTPGEHKLQLVLGNHLHIPHEPPVTSAVITVTVIAED